MSFLVITPKGILNECKLTARELAVLQCVADGRSNKEIAAQLFISSETVKTHLKNSYAKLQARNRLDALRKAGLL
jgi:LuxR family maltose regulon positive regulatory protein